MSVFLKKHEPHLFKDLVFPDSRTRQRLCEFASNKRHGSMIFHGPYGTAKTTTARLLANMRTEGLDYGGLPFYRATDMGEATFDEIANQQSIARLCGVEHPVTVIDEIDHVAGELQYKLRWELDLRAAFGCFIFTTNKLYNVDKGIVDRCDVIELPSATSAQWLERARSILIDEGVPLPDEKILELLETCNGSIRDLMRALEDVVLRYPKLVA